VEGVREKGTEEKEWVFGSEEGLTGAGDNGIMGSFITLSDRFNIWHMLEGEKYVYVSGWRDWRPMPARNIQV